MLGFFTVFQDGVGSPQWGVDMLSAVAFIGSIGPMELLLFMAIGLLIFGKRLPEVGKSLGKGISEFKKGLSGVEEDEMPSEGSTKRERRRPPAELEHDVIDQEAPPTPTEKPAQPAGPAAHSSAKKA